MSKHVHICGLYRQDLQGETLTSLKAGGAQVWTCNDWYRCYPWMVPDRVVNPHYFPHISADSDRFPGDWKAWYNNVIENDGKISVVELIEGVDPSGQELLPENLASEFNMSSLGCSISLMICLAIHHGFNKITLRGVRLRDEEYSHQIDFIRNALRHCILRGVQVINPFADEWSARNVPKIDWNNVVDMDVGSVPHLVRYFKPELRNLN